MVGGLFFLRVMAVSMALILSFAAKAGAGAGHDAPSPSDGRRILFLHGAIAGTIVGYSVVNWQKQDRPAFAFKDDGWFEESSPNGGADKTGHAFSTYVISRVFSALYRRLGVEERRADWQGPLAAFSSMILVELSDAFQTYGFSYKDIVANGAGACLAFLEERHAALDDMVDYRVEYLPSKSFLESGETDILTDYSGMKHLLVFKLSGLQRLRQGPLSYVELHAGYFTTGTSYARPEEEKSRNLYAGVSLNFSKILRRAGGERKLFRGASKLLEFYQLPYVSVDAVKSYGLKGGP